MVQVEIRCPTCKKRGKIQVAQERIEQVTRGLLAVNIAPNVICEHSFIVYIDKNFEIRSYFIADFKVSLPRITKTEKEEDMETLSKHISDVDLIKLNLNALMLAYVLKSIFSKQKIVLLIDQEFLHEYIKDFFNYITKDSFDYDISLLKEKEYKQNKKQFKDCVVLQKYNIIRDPDKIIDPKKLKIEKQIIHNFMTESDLGFSYIKLKNEIEKVYRFTNFIVDYITQDEDKKKPNTIYLKKVLEEHYGTKIDQVYMNFLTDVVKSYFGIKLLSTTESLFDIL